MGRWERLLPVLVAVLLAGPLLLAVGGAAVYVGNGTDLYSYQIPLRSWAAAELSSLSLPVWYPWLLGGVASHAAAQLGLTYPPHWLLPLQTPHLSTLLMALHVAWLALGGAALARAWRPALAQGWPLAAAAGLLAACGPVWGHAFAGHVSFVEAVAWTPWLWAACVTALRTRKALALLAAIGALGMQLLAGHPQVAYLSLVGVAVVLLAEVVDPLRDHPPAERWPTAPGSLVVLMGLVLLGSGAAALAAVQLWPTAQLQPALNRQLAQPLEIATAFSEPARSLWTLVAPGVWGGPDVSLADVGYHETVAYLGAGGLGLALLGLVRGGTRALVLAGGLLLAALLSLGSEGPLMPALLDLMPGLGLFRVPGRWVLVVCMLATLLAIDGLVPADPRPVVAAASKRWLGHTVLGAATLCLVGAALTVSPQTGWWAQRLSGKLTDPQAIALVAGSTRLALLLAGTAALAAWLAWWRPKWHGRVALALGILVLLQGLAFARSHVSAKHTRPVDEVRWPTADLAVLHKTVPPAHRLATAASLRHANRGGTAAVRLAGGYEPAVTASANLYGNALAGRKVPGYSVNFQVRGPSPWLDRLATSHVLLDPRDGQAQRAFAAWPVQANLPSGRVLRAHPQPRSRFEVPARLEVEPDPARAVERLRDLPPDTVVVAEALGPVGPARLQPRQDTPQRTEIEVRADAPTVVVLRDALAPGWTAAVDGQPTRTTLADGLFRAAVVPAGTHVLTWTYQAPGLGLGAWVSGLALLAWLAAVGWLLRRR